MGSVLESLRAKEKANLKKFHIMICTHQPKGINEGKSFEALPACTMLTAEKYHVIELITKPDELAYISTLVLQETQNFTIWAWMPQSQKGRVSRSGRSGDGRRLILGVGGGVSSAP